MQSLDSQDALKVNLSVRILDLPASCAGLRMGDNTASSRCLLRGDILGGAHTQESL